MLTATLEAVKEIIDQSASEILKMYILDVDKSTHSWSPQQAWLLVEELANTGNVRYNELLLSDIFKSNGEPTLQALEQAELISIVSSNGRPYSIKPGKPVYQAAFKRLTQDHVLKARMDLAILTELTKIETQSIDKYEAELNLLANLPKQPGEIAPRIKWLLSKLQSSHAKVEKYEQEGSVLKKVLKVEY